MQKHEREALKTAESILIPAGFTITASHGRRGKMSIRVIGPGGITDRRTISSSPSDGRMDGWT